MLMKYNFGLSGRLEEGMYFDQAQKIVNCQRNSVIAAQALRSLAILTGNMEQGQAWRAYWSLDASISTDQSECGRIS